MNESSRWIFAALAVALAHNHVGAQTTELVSVDTGGAQGNLSSSMPSVSADGRFVAFVSDASNLAPSDTNGADDVFVHDRQSGRTELVSVATDGTQGNGASGIQRPSISADGRFVAFNGFASSLVAGDTHGFIDVFVRDRQTGTTERVSLSTGGAEGNWHSTAPSISTDGRFVAFSGLATNLVAGDTNGTSDIFVHDRQTGTTELASVATGGAQANSLSGDPSISADGRFVAFRSAASNLVAGDTNGFGDVFVRDLHTGTTERVSVATSGAQANNLFGSHLPSISADGRFVAFYSYATNLVPGDGNGTPDVFVRDRQSGTTERASVATDGAQGNEASFAPSISAEGRFVAFESDASDLVAIDTNAQRDIFVHDRQSGTTERVSVDTGGAQANSLSDFSSISADGRFVAFQSFASNLVAGDKNGLNDGFLRDRGEPPVLASCFGDGTGVACPCGNNGLAGRGCENSSSTGGARLSASGSSSLSADALVLTSSNETSNALSIFMQGSDLIAPVFFGDGLRCAGGKIQRLFYVVSAPGGVATAPQASDPTVSLRSAELGHPIPLGATRHYQTYYRDSDLAFCPNPPGNSWNISNALSTVWSP